MEDCLDAVDHERMAGVVPALKPHDDVRLGGEQIDDLSLALVAPLKTDDDDALNLVR